MMRALNFLFLFLICLALVLFSLENTEPATLNIVQGVQVQAPLSIELIVATGFGALLAWLFSLWSRMQRMLTVREQSRQTREKDQRIQELEQDLERYKTQQAEIEASPALLTASGHETPASQTTEGQSHEEVIAS